jgi:alpha-L-rhamnosidase
MVRKAPTGLGIMKRNNCCVAALALVFAGAVNGAHANVAKTPVALTDMRAEGVVQPMGVEEAAPRFSWRYEAGADAPRGFRQSAYRVQVASSAEKLAKGEADMWDSGRQTGSDTLSILYAGKPLASAARYYWQATGFDGAGKAYPSKPQFFEMGLLKAGDWSGAQWIGAKAERPKTLPAYLQRLKDYSFETRFRILEGSAAFRFRAAYCWSKHCGIEIQPGVPGKFIVTKMINNKSEVLGEYPLPSFSTNQWHTLQVTARGTNFSFRLDDAPINNEPLHDDIIQEGTVGLGAAGEKGKKGVVQFDDFKLTVNNETLVQESFNDPVMFAFQDIFFSNNSYSKVQGGVMEVSSLNVYVDPKEGLEAPLFRKAFATEPKKVVRARAYVAGLGYYTFWLNGKRLDDYLLHPGNARYNKTAYYTVYDLTGHLEKDNVLGFELGRGWYAMTTPTLWGETFYPDWMAEPTLRSVVTIDYADGSRQTVISDPSFKTAPGPILLDSVKAGEIYDARKEQPGWDKPGFDDQKWSAAVISKGVMPSAAPGLTAQLFEPIRVVESIPAASIQKIEDEADAWLVDFGRHMAGSVELRFNSTPGLRIRIAYLERERAQFSPDRWNSFNALTTGCFQNDIFIAKGGPGETFQPRYSYNGFRYIRLEGLKEKPAPEQVTAKVFNSDMASAGEFRCSSELWNKIWMAGRRSIQSNMHSIPTDCPTQEKLAWTCDDSSPFYAMAYNFDLRKLYEKRLQDYADDISPDGRINNVLPSTWAKGDDPAWVGSYVNIAWLHYLTYGDRRVIERHYDNLKRYMGTLVKTGQASEKPPLHTKPQRGLGDWVHPDGGNCPPEGALIYHNLYFFKYARQMAEMAQVIGRAEDENYYANLAAELKKAFNEYHFDEKDGFYYSTNRELGFRQSPQAIALAFGVVPEEKVDGLVKRLVEDIQQKRKSHFWVGILGMEAIADALSENGRDDVAYTAHLKDQFPSLGNMIREGATTIWEDYAFNRVRSLNHKMFATPLGWMARYVAGLRVEGVLGEGPGFRKVVIEPYPCPEQVSFAQLKHDSPLGRYESGWRKTDRGMEYEIVVPPNATATVRLPIDGQAEAVVAESGKIIWKAGKGSLSDGYGTPRIENGRWVCEIGSGRYRFTISRAQAVAP